MESITPSPERSRGNGPKTRPGIKSPPRGDVIPNLPIPAETLAPLERGGGQTL